MPRPDHSHSYGEVGYIVEGGGGPDVMRLAGVLHVSGDPASFFFDEAGATTA